MMETNFLSVVALTKEVVKGMVARNRGHVVMMSSIAGKEGYHGAQHCNMACGMSVAMVGQATAVAIVFDQQCLIAQPLQATRLPTTPALLQMHTVMPPPG